LRSRLYSQERVMPITEFLDGFKFDHETRRLLGAAYEMSCASLKFEDQTYIVHETIANRIIELAKNGVLDPDRLCEQALGELRKSTPPPFRTGKVSRLR
jgi:hypothetical protein